MSRQPFVYWAQNEQQVFLTVDLKDSTDAEYCIFENIFEFHAIGIGAQGRCEYNFALNLFGEIDMEKASEECGRRLLYVLRKKTAAWWPYLTKDGSRFSWLRVDFDRFKDPEDSETENGFEMIKVDQQTPEEQVDALTQKILRECGSLESVPQSLAYCLKDLKKKYNKGIARYLFIYNILLFLLSLYTLISLVYGFVGYGREYLNTFWNTSSTIIMLATIAQLLDILHALTGITRGNYIAGCIQVCGRLAMIQIIDGCTDVQTNAATLALFVTYFSIEIFRYPYYALKSINIKKDSLTRLRYSMWIPLYPAGLVLEGFTIYSSIPFYRKNVVYDISIVNLITVYFNLGVFLTIFLCTIFPAIACYLMRHMWRQRYKQMKKIRKKHW